MPEVTYFKPVGIPLAQLQEVRLSVEEAEAIRLKDLEGLEQEECAQKMNVSRTTFSRVLSSARRKVADALLKGKAVRIEGGNFEMAMRRFRCIRGHEWDVPFEEITGTPTHACPTCDARDVVALQPWRLGKAGRGQRRRGGRNW